MAIAWQSESGAPEATMRQQPAFRSTTEMHLAVVPSFRDER